MSNTIVLSNGRTLEVNETSITAWPSAGAAERGDPAQALHKMDWPPEHPYVSVPRAAEATGIPYDTISHAARRGQIENVRAGQRARLLYVPSLIAYAAGWPHSTGGEMAERDIPHGADPCSNCGQAPVAYKELCWTCYTYERRHDEPRPRRLWAEEEESA